MKIKFKWFFSLLLIILCLTSIAQADGNYYTFVGEVSYIDDQNFILSESVRVGMPINYTFFVDFNSEGELLRNDGQQAGIPEGSGVENFYCDYFSGSGLNAINEGYYNDDHHFAAYNYGLNVTHQETGQHTGYLYGRSVNDRVSIDSYLFWIKELNPGASVSSRNQVYDSDGNRAIVYGLLILESISETPPIEEVIIDIKLESNSNCFNNDGNGVIPVAILSDCQDGYIPADGFYATQVDPESVELAGLTVRALGKSNKFLAHIKDVNDDGCDDLVVQIEDQDEAFNSGSGTADLIGNLYEEFGGTSIMGRDNICVVQ